MFGQISVLDNFVPGHVADTICKIVFGTENLLQDAKDVNGIMPFITKIDKTSPGMVSFATPIFSSEMIYADKHHSTQIRRFVHDLAKQHILSHPFVNSLIPLHGRMFLQLPMSVNQTHKEPHVNLPGQKHVVVLYYVNDSDGTTAFYNEDGSLRQEVEPKANRLVIFDGSIKHSVGIPRYNTRVVLTYDLLFE